MMLWLAAAFFLPLFPLSMALNAVLARLRNPVARAVLLLLWPQIGVLLLQMAPHGAPAYFLPWALSTAGLYALRLLTVRDMGLWASFLATSALALVWTLVDAGAGRATLHLSAFWLGLPPALLALLTGPLTRRFGAAYAGVQDGLIGSLPRLSGVLAMTVLAAVATPPFSGFFALLGILHALDWPAALGVLTIWLLWGWAATRLLQGFIFGAGRPVAQADIGWAPTLAVASLLGVFAAAGLYLNGGGL